MRIALNAGWTRSDLFWERIQEAANRGFSEARFLRPAMLVLAGCGLACLRFERKDPRRITSFANLAFLLNRIGARRLARSCYTSTCAAWTSVAPQASHVGVRARARSSLFHLRMEAKNWESYKANMRVRLGAFVNEAGECLASLRDGEDPPHRLYSRWKGAKPPVFDDSRKLLSACLLILHAP